MQYRCGTRHYIMRLGGGACVGSQEEGWRRAGARVVAGQHQRVIAACRPCSKPTRLLAAPRVCGCQDQYQSFQAARAVPGTPEGANPMRLRRRFRRSMQRPAHEEAAARRRCRPLSACAPRWRSHQSERPVPRHHSPSQPLLRDSQHLIRCCPAPRRALRHGVGLSGSPGAAGISDGRGSDANGSQQPKGAESSRGTHRCSSSTHPGAAGSAAQGVERCQLP